jgi:hypothetical protein
MVLKYCDSLVAGQVLVRNCPSQAWVQHQRVMEIIQLQVQPKKGPTEGTTEYNMKNYVSNS